MAPHPHTPDEPTLTPLGPHRYPHEEEVLFGPLTALEVVGTNAEDSMLVICVRLSVNLASPTLERVIGKMQNAHLDLLSILQTKIARESPSEVPKLLELRAQAEAESPGGSFYVSYDAAIRSPLLDQLIHKQERRVT